MISDVSILRQAVASRRSLKISTGVGFEPIHELWTFAVAVLRVKEKMVPYL